MILYLLAVLVKIIRQVRDMLNKLEAKDEIHRVHHMPRRCVVLEYLL